MLHKLNGQMLPFWYFYLTCYFQEKFVLISFVTFAVIVAHPNMFSAVTSECSKLWRQVREVTALMSGSAHVEEAQYVYTDPRPPYQL